MPDIPEIALAAALARAAPAQLQAAKLLEDSLSNSWNWNRASWTVWGGTYAGPERGGRENEEWLSKDEQSKLDDVDVENDGGWKVEAGKHPLKTQSLVVEGSHALNSD